MKQDIHNSTANHYEALLFGAIVIRCIAAHSLYTIEVNSHLQEAALKWTLSEIWLNKSKDH